MSEPKKTSEISIEISSWPAGILLLAVVISWICGIAVAKDFWATVGSFLIPPLAWIILASHFLN